MQLDVELTGLSPDNHIEKHLDEEPIVEDPTLAIIMPKWAYTTVEKAAPFI